MRNLEKEFSKRAINYDKLIEYGFSKDGEKYLYKRNILDDSFEVNIIISKNEIKSKVIDLFDNTEYALVDVETAVGEFVGTVRQEYENVINNVIENCTQSEKFKFSQTKELIKYVKETYGDELEFLWEKYDDNAIWRNKDNNKWYAVLLTITEDKLKKNSSKKVEIVDLMYQKEEIDKIVDGKNIYPGYHMNKKSWITVILDNSMDNESLFKLVDNSYKLSLGSKKIRSKKKA